MTTEMMKNKVYNLRSGAKAALAFTQIVRDPHQLDEIFSLSASLVRPDHLRGMVAQFRAKETGRLALERKPRVGRLDFNELRQLPEGSLGRVFAEHMISRGLSPDAIPTLEGNTDEEYVRAHLYETHDLWHVLTGYDTDVAGELGLQAFYLAQYFGRLAPMLLAGGLMNTVLFESHDYARRMDAIARGWMAGRKAKPLFGADWAALLSRPIDEVRAEYGIEVEIRGGEEKGSIGSAA